MPDRKTNCKNCGAPLSLEGGQCEYCGTVNYGTVKAQNIRSTIEITADCIRIGTLTEQYLAKDHRRLTDYLSGQIS